LNDGGILPAPDLGTGSKGIQIEGHKAAGIANLERRANVLLVSNMPDDLVRRLFMPPVARVPEALQTELQDLGPGSQVLVLRQTGSIIPDFDE